MSQLLCTVPARLWGTRLPLSPAAEREGRSLHTLGRLCEAEEMLVECGNLIQQKAGTQGSKVEADWFPSCEGLGGDLRVGGRMVRVSCRILWRRWRDGSVGKAPVGKHQDLSSESQHFHKEKLGQQRTPGTPALGMQAGRPREPNPELQVQRMNELQGGDFYIMRMMSPSTF